MTPVVGVENPWEAESRMRKAIALADVLFPNLERAASECSCSETELLAVLDDEAWKLATKAARVNPPSETTKALVAQIVAERVRARDADPYDIFKRFQED